jgi:Amt family ammonium transporter
VSKKMRYIIILIAVVVIFATLAIPAFAGDPSGLKTGGKDSYDALFAGKSVKEAIGHTGVAINFVWVFLAAVLVFFMQAGFALVETGFCRAKSASHVIMTNLMIFAIGALAYWAIGFGLMFGGASGISSLGGTAPLNGLFEIAKGWGIFGTKGFFLVGASYDVGVFLLFMFQMVFMDTTATIPTGGMAERWKFSAFCVYGVFIAGIMYPIYGNWVWGGGWLSKLGVNLSLGNGYVDWAGSSVIHAVGGFTALAGAMVLGPRIGKFNKDGSPNAIPGHHIPMAILGTIILAFGWFGFNAGSSLSALDLRISVIAVNTMLAGAAGSITAMLYVWNRFGKPDPSMAANGMLAGLVAITAGCAFVGPVSAVIIGGIAGILVVVSVLFVERVLKIDDPVGAVSVHGVNGIWGVIALGIFADGTYGAGFNGVSTSVKGLLYGGTTQFYAQLIGAGVAIVYAFCIAYAFFKIQDRLMGIRSSREDELSGLDVPEMGVLAYPEFEGSGLDAGNGRASGSQSGTFRPEEG